MILSLIVALSSLIGQISQNICSLSMDTVSDPILAKDYVIASDKGYENGSDMRELFLKVPMDEAELQEYLSLQQEDGSWSDINYGDVNRGAWKPGQHGFRVQRLAIKYRQSGDKRALAAALKGMDYWFSAGLVCLNWWHNQIGIPRLMGPAFVLLRDEMNEAQLQGAITVMDNAKLKMTGQNKVWLAGNVLIRALLQDDEALVMQARDSIVSEIGVSDNIEGLQKDWSFHQHGPQLQFGNYGLSYACTLSWWAKVFEGTSLAIPEESLSQLKNFVEKGLGLVIWNGWFDMNACARQVFLNSQRGKALCVADAASNLGLDLTGKKWGSYYPLSDFGIYRGRNWYASIRMQSLRVLGYETTNKENMKSYFSSDGALLVRTEGDEYNDVAPYWNWKKVPGVTSYDDGKPLYGNKPGQKDSDFKNLTDKVFGAVKGRRMAAAMEIRRDTLEARKAWFFFPSGVICLGAGITRPVDEPVVTTIQQCRLTGPVSEGNGWANHAGITYVVLDGAYSAATVTRTGPWSDISPAYATDFTATGELFEMTIDHGKSPKGATYAYVVAPDSGKNGRRAAARMRRRVKVIENTPERQKVRIGFRTITVDWQTGSISF